MERIALRQKFCYLFESASVLHSTSVVPYRYLISFEKSIQYMRKFRIHHVLSSGEFKKCFLLIKVSVLSSSVFQLFQLSNKTKIILFWWLEMLKKILQNLDLRIRVFEQDFRVRIMKVNSLVISILKSHSLSAYRLRRNTEDDGCYFMRKFKYNLSPLFAVF